MTDAGTNSDVWSWNVKRETAATGIAEGKSYRTIAAEIDVAVNTVLRWTKHPEFQSRVDEIIEEVVGDARRILRRNAAAAAQQLVHLHTSGHSMHAVKLAACKDILDRVGLKSPEKIEHGGTIGTYVVDLGVSHDSSTG